MHVLNITARTCTVERAKVKVNISVYNITQKLSLKVVKCLVINGVVFRVTRSHNATEKPGNEILLNAVLR